MAPLEQSQKKDAAKSLLADSFLLRWASRIAAVAIFIALCGYLDAIMVCPLSRLLRFVSLTCKCLGPMVCSGPDRATRAG